MKSVMLSIQPKWCKKIADRNKTIEIRKTRPKIDVPFKCYIYCTKGNLPNDILRVVCCEDGGYVVNGTVIGEFVCDELEDFQEFEYDYPALLRHINLRASTNGDYLFLNDYLKGEKKGYSWNISDLKIYDKPKKLNEFGLNRPPQSWCYVESEGKE